MLPKQFRRYMAEILPIRRKTLSSQSINQLKQLFFAFDVNKVFGVTVENLYNYQQACLKIRLEYVPATPCL